MTSTSWTKKYQPKHLSEIKGQELAIEELKNFIEKFKESETDKKSVILYGPPGTGKTTLAYVMANESNFEIFELNASDLRGGEKLREVLAPAIEQKSLTKKGKFLLIDEVDGISEADRGGLSELLRIIEFTSQLVIITANDIWNKKFSELRKKSEIIPLKEIDSKTIKNALIEILRKEKKFLKEDILTNITIKAKGDIRAAINDLQVASSLSDPSEIFIDERNKEIDIFNVLRIILKEKSDNSLLNLFDSVNKPMDEILLWIEENIPQDYNPEELARAYELLSKADIFRNRVYKQQYWRFLVYSNAFLSYGISSSKKSEKIGFTNYKKPTRILKMWMNNQKIEKKKSIAEKYANYVHVGKKRALKEFPMIKQFLLKSQVQKELRLTEEEINYLNNSA
ncbi:replication factor C large subunit [Candidatus Pacearchaeota archaeon]|nr:replication factor C large subunit [Candidatus Pacearchaeota archaeon]